MIFAGGRLLPDQELNPVLGHLAEEVTQTLGGPPLAAETVLDIFRSRDLVSHAKEMGRYLWDKLEEIKDKYAVVTGEGLLRRQRQSRFLLTVMETSGERSLAARR